MTERAADAAPFVELGLALQAGIFPTLTRRRLERGALQSPMDLQAAINRYLDGHNGSPRPFV